MTPGEKEIARAAVERILPGDDGPGATEANVIAYLEWITGQDRFRSHTQCLTSGLTLLESLAQGFHQKGFAACDAIEQDAILHRIEAIPHPTVQRFFVMLVRMTLAGFLCAPEYGGNRGEVGWASIGFDGRRRHRAAPAR